MNQLPEHVQHAPLTGQPLMPAEVELSGERASMVWIPGPGNQFIAVPRNTIPAEYFQAPKPLEPIQRQGMDPRAQLMLAAGAGTGMAGAGIGWGLGQAMAGLSSGGGLFMLCLLAAWKLSSVRGASGSTTNIHHEVHNHNRWFGKSTTRM